MSHCLTPSTAMGGNESLPDPFNRDGAEMSHCLTPSTEMGGDRNRVLQAGQTVSVYIYPALTDLTLVEQDGSRVARADLFFHLGSSI
jgi:hypothetical protein